MNMLSLNVLRMPCSKVWHAACAEVLAISSFEERPFLKQGKMQWWRCCWAMWPRCMAWEHALRGGCECGSGSHLMPFPTNKIASHQGSSAFRKLKKDFQQISYLAPVLRTILVYERKMPMSTFTEVLVLCSTWNGQVSHGECILKNINCL